MIREAAGTYLPVGPGRSEPPCRRESENRQRLEYSFSSLGKTQVSGRGIIRNLEIPPGDLTPLLLVSLKGLQPTAGCGAAECGGGRGRGREPYGALAVHSRGRSADAPAG